MQLVWLFPSGKLRIMVAVVYWGVYWLSGPVYWGILEFTAIAAHLSVRSLEALFKRVQLPFAQQVGVALQTSHLDYFIPSLARPVWFMWKKNYITHASRFTLRLGLNFCQRRHQKVDRLWCLRREERGMGEQEELKKKSCVKANSLLVSFCVISCTVGHCSTHCIYSKAQCHTPLWKRALRNIVSTHPAASTLPSSIHPVPLLSNFIHFISFIYCLHFCKFWAFFISAKIHIFETCSTKQFNQSYWVSQY